MRTPPLPKDLWLLAPLLGLVAAVLLLAPSSAAGIDRWLRDGLLVLCFVFAGGLLVVRQLRERAEQRQALLAIESLAAEDLDRLSESADERVAGLAPQWREAICRLQSRLATLDYWAQEAELARAAARDSERCPANPAKSAASLGGELHQRNADFVSAVSHEMKTPLAGIKAYVELLVDGDAEDEETRLEFLEIINAQADRLQQLVDNMLNLARIESGTVRVKKERLPLNELLLESLREVDSAANARAITLADELSSECPEVLVDRNLLRQAAVHLLSNAVKYTQRGGQVTLRSQVSEHEVLVEVEDTGAGLSPDDCANVFEKFYRVQRDRETASGTGLGLPLVKHIVEDIHGGRVTVESALGHGSVFRLALPCRVAVPAIA